MPQPEKQKELRIALIAAGGRGRIAKLAHQPEQNVKLVGICDLRPEIHQEYRDEFGQDMFVTSDYRQLLAMENLDAVFVTSPDFLHEEHALAALNRGLGVYLEKPMAITIEGCDRILRAARENQAKLYVGHNMRFFPVIQKIKELIEQDRIGQVQAIWCRHFVSNGGDWYFKDWHSERQYSTGLLLQKAAHDIDLLHWFAGAYTQRVVAMGKLSVYNRVQDRRTSPRTEEVSASPDHWPPLQQTGMSPVIDVEDHSMVLMQMANGVQASYTQCHYTPDSHRNYTVIGTRGRIENIGDHSTEDQQARIRLWTSRGRFNEQGNEQIPIKHLEGTHGGADPRIVNDFLHYLRTGENRGAHPMDARMSVAAGYLATTSLREANQPFDIPEPH